MILDMSSGSSMDWAKAEAGIKYSFAPELRDLKYLYMVSKIQLEINSYLKFITRKETLLTSTRFSNTHSCVKTKPELDLM